MPFKEQLENCCKQVKPQNLPSYKKLLQELTPQNPDLPIYLRRLAEGLVNALGSNIDENTQAPYYVAYLLAILRKFPTAKGMCDPVKYEQYKAATEHYDLTQLPVLVDAQLKLTAKIEYEKDNNEFDETKVPEDEKNDPIEQLILLNERIDELMQVQTTLLYYQFGSLNPNTWLYLVANAADVANAIPLIEQDKVDKGKILSEIAWDAWQKSDKISNQCSLEALYQLKPGKNIFGRVYDFFAGNNTPSHSVTTPLPMDVGAIGSVSVKDSNSSSANPDPSAMPSIPTRRIPI